MSIPKAPKSKQSVKRRKSAARVPLTRERVLDAALQLANSQGIEALSMRKLAETLKVEAMSLYNHVANKEDLQMGLVERVVAEIDLPVVGGDWRAEMRKRAHSAHAALLRHPWASQLIVAGLNIGPVMLKYVDATLGCLREAGFSYLLADRAWNAIDSHIYGFTLQELNFPLEPAEYASAAQAFLPMIPADQYPYLNALSQLVSEGQHTGLHDFSFGLELLLNGLEALRLQTTGSEASSLAPQQGELYWLHMPKAGESGPQVAHPHLVLQDDLFNLSRLQTVVLCALTSNPKRANEPGNVLLEAGEANLPKPSVVVVSQLETVNKSQLGEYIGCLSPERVAEILAGLRFQQRSFFRNHPE